MDYKTVLIHNTQLSGFFFRLQNVHALPNKTVLRLSLQNTQFKPTIDASNLQQRGRLNTLFKPE